MNDDAYDYEPEVATVGPRRLELRVYGHDDEPGVEIAAAAPPWIRPRTLPQREPNVLTLRRALRL